ncbi:hypothetical protein AQUCO_00200426v1 [Aquilegia coerulea]|uniref:Uncharacterized protein n=1 Tax=Aquilegia coerulea TaxID=218851 RepID=A0A2G5F366_AQUCA|nr:hypothetical protein AQUCO_00200426v1 [Aquilegia coerulea]
MFTENSFYSRKMDCLSTMLGKRTVLLPLRCHSSTLFPPTLRQRFVDLYGRGSPGFLTAIHVAYEWVGIIGHGKHLLHRFKQPNVANKIEADKLCVCSEV